MHFGGRANCLKKMDVKELKDWLETNGIPSETAEDFESWLFFFHVYSLRISLC